MKKILFFTFFLFLFVKSSTSLLINEIYPNPKISHDKYGEWIELINEQNKTINLTITLQVNSKNFSIPNVLLGSKEYLLIVDNSSYFISRWNVSKNIVELNIKLPNDHGNITLFNESGFIDSITYSSISDGESFGRYPDGGKNLVDMFPTPGDKNTIVSINLNLFSFFENEEYINLFRIKIKGKTNNTTDWFNVNYFIINMNNTVIVNETFFKEVVFWSSSNTGQWKPEKAGNYTICWKVINSSLYIERMLRCENVFVYESPFKLLNYKRKLSFGEIGYITIEIENNSKPLKILVYGKSKRVVSDFLGNKIKKFSKCDNGQNISLDGKKIMVIIPFMIYPNCDDYYDDGIYPIAVRVCDDQGNKLYEEIIDILVSGRIESFCPTTRIVYKETKKQTVSKVSTKSQKIVSIINYPRRIGNGEKFETKIKVYNPFNEPKNFTIYSYVFRNNKLVSEGYRNGELLKGWDANKIFVLIYPNHTKTLTLVNRIKNNVIGNYSLRVRVKNVVDVTIPIEILDLKPNISIRCYSSRRNAYLRIKNYGGPQKIYGVYIGNGTKTFVLDLNSKDTLVMKFGPFENTSFFVFFQNQTKNCTTKLLEVRGKKRNITGLFFYSFLNKISNLISLFIGKILFK